MNLRQLQVFASVARNMSFSNAAEELMMSQPAVSQQVRTLEQQLDVKLFEWTGQRLFLTDAGEAIRAHADAILEHGNEIGLAIAELRGPTRGKLVLGANTTGGMYVLPAIARAFLAQHPDARLTLQIEPTNRIVDRIMQNFIDIAVVTGPLADERLTIADLYRDELYLICSPAHPFAARDSVPVADAVAERWVLYTPGSRTRALVQRAFGGMGFKLAAAMQLASTEAVKKAVEANLGVAMVSRYAVERELKLDALVRVPLDGLTIERPIHALYRKDKRLTPLAARFFEFAAAFAPGDTTFART
ncbi:MAG: LysR family transcriptional regulator [Solirubrobacteraceae bacterium]